MSMATSTKGMFEAAFSEKKTLPAVKLVGGCIMIEDAWQPGMQEMLHTHKKN